ncbi:MAG: tetratricopeptide repeat protein [Bacteroidota bacterium]
MAGKKHSSQPELPLETMLAFLEDRLPATEKARVEKILQENQLYAQAIKDLDIARQEDPHTAQKALKYRSAFSEGLAKAAQQPEQEKYQSPPVFWKMAAVILILVFPVAYYFLNAGADMGQLEDSYLIAYAWQGTKGSAATDQADQLEKAFQAYRAQDYAQAITRFQGFAQAYPDSLSSIEMQRVNMYHGVSLLFTDQAQAAIPLLSAVIDHGDNTFISDALWYRSWAYWKAGQKGQAQQAFSELAGSPGKHQQQAEEILEAIP